MIHGVGVMLLAGLIMGTYRFFAFSSEKDRK